MQNSYRFDKRQAQVTRSIVHVTVTADGTVVYTQTATSYSYIPSYSTISSTGTTLPDNNQSSNNNNQQSSSTNTGAIIGGVIGGVAGLAIIALGLFFLRRSNKNKKEKDTSTMVVDDNDSYYAGHRHQRSPSKATILDRNNAGVTMTSLTPTPRHFIAPSEANGEQDERQNNGHSDAYFYNGHGYYDDIQAPYSKSYYPVNGSVTTESAPSTAIEGSTSTGYYTGARHVPDEIIYPIYSNQAERHVPHLKDDIPVEPPHTKD